MTDDVGADQLVERTDTGVSITSTLKRGSGTRDEDKHAVNAKGHTFADVVAIHQDAMNYLEGELLDRARTIQPSGDDGGGEPCPRRPPSRRSSTTTRAWRCGRATSYQAREPPATVIVARSRTGRRSPRSRPLGTENDHTMSTTTPTLPARTHRPPWTPSTPRTERGPNSRRPSTSGFRPRSPRSSPGVPAPRHPRGRGHAVEGLEPLFCKHSTGSSSTGSENETHRVLFETWVPSRSERHVA